MKAFMLLAPFLFSAALAAQYSVSSGAITGGYQDLAQKTIVSPFMGIPMPDDDGWGPISPTGFSFPCFGTHYTDFVICDNGYLVLGSTAFGYPYVTTTPNFIMAPGPQIAPLWHDYYPSGNAYGYGSYGEIAWHWDPPVLTVEWRLERKRTGTALTLPPPGTRMQARLDCGSGVIECRYGDPDPDYFGTTATYDYACSVSNTSSFTVPGYDPGYVSSAGRVQTYPAGRYIRFTPTSLPLHITNTCVLPDATCSSVYTHQFNGISGTPPYHWAASNLPAGWGIDSGSGLLSAPATATQPGTFDFTITLTDQAPNRVHNLLCTVNVVIAPLAILTQSTLPTGGHGTAYSHQFAAQGGVPPYTWAAGGMPTGWQMSAAGLLSAAAGDVQYGSYAFDVTVQDAHTPQGNDTRQFTVLITPPPLLITTTSIGPFTAGAQASAVMHAAGGYGAPYTWSASGLPGGWSIMLASGEIAAAAGDVVAGSYNVTITVADAQGQLESQPFTIDVIPPGALAISTGTTLTSAQPGFALARDFNAVGGVPPYSWSATSLPAGWTLDVSTGHLAATPAAVVPGTYSFQVTVADSAVPQAGYSDTFTLAVNPWPPITAGATTLPDGIEGVPYAASFTVSGGTGAGYQFAVSVADLPPGITMNSSAVAAGFSGTPTAAGTFGFTVQVSDSGGNTLDLPLTIRVAPSSASVGGASSSDGAGGCAAGAGGLLLWPLLLAPLLRRRRK